MSTIKKFNFRTLLLSATIGAALGTVLGVLIAPQLLSDPTNPSTCNAPMSVKLVQKNANSAKIMWDSVPGIENYLITVRDSSALSISEAVYTVKGKEFTVPDLKANHGYRLDVQSLCKRTDAGSSVSSTARSLGVRTQDFIIVIVVEFNGADPCTKTNCNTSVSLNAQKCFNWSTGTIYYQMDITRNGSLTPAAKLFFEKSTNTNGLPQIKLVNNLVCGTKVYAQNSPQNLNCNNTIATAHLCGTLPYTPQGGTPTTIPYRLEFTNSQCCVVFDDPAQAANYTVKVTQCTDIFTQ